MMGDTKVGGSNRKKGRSSRSPAKAAYNLQMRWAKNKRLKVKRHYKRTGQKDRQAERWLAEN